MKCLETITEDVQRRILTKFLHLPDKDTQDLYFQRLVTSQITCSVWWKQMNKGVLSCFLEYSCCHP
ncbi:hypothetical protein PR048_018400 [Dryococelus australis]|uniref:Uncharacterized protein n=1 Tax=Dryococelus australis TaxID=614101 RepID=A0ABQ9HCC3_9NEOP|nr:hypothetical protein PR048_018400 [Dryococelus australis]